jgi:hypothetical protein
MKYDKIEGLDKEMATLVMGTDSRPYVDAAVKLWDHWIDVGGNACDPPP